MLFEINLKIFKNSYKNNPYIKVPKHRGTSLHFITLQEAGEGKLKEVLRENLTASDILRNFQNCTPNIECSMTGLAGNTLNFFN